MREPLVRTGCLERLGADSDFIQEKTIGAGLTRAGAAAEAWLRPVSKS